MVQHLGSSLSETRRFRIGRGVRCTLNRLPERSQRPSRSSLPLDLHRSTVGSRHALQPNTPPATSWSGVVWHPPSAIRPLSLPDRKSTRLNSSHLVISYAVFCLK